MKLSLSWIWITFLSLVGSILAPTVQANVTLLDFHAEAGADTITLYWETASETNNLGFHLWRGQELADGYVDISGFIASLDEGAGAAYVYEDANVTPGITYYYKLRDVPDSGGLGSFSAPVSATLSLGTATPTPTITPTPTQTPTPPPPGIPCGTGARLRSTSFTAPIAVNLPQAPHAAEVEPKDAGAEQLVTPTPSPTPTPTNTTTPTPVPTRPPVVPPPPGTPVEVEPNDTIITANRLAAPGKIVGAVTRIDDMDCFAINIADTLIGTHYHFILKDYGLTRWLKVYDNNGYYIMGNTTATNHKVELTLQAALPRYYLCVSSVTAASPADTIVDYLLEVTAPRPPIKIYLPLVLRDWPLSPPLPVGATVRFKGAWYDMPLEGVVTCSENCGILYHYSTPYYPQGAFVVVLMDVTNHGLRSDEVGQHNAFKVQDSAGRIFDLASLKFHQAAEYTYQRESLYSPIQPGFTVPLVFVFDVLPQSEELRLVAVQPW